MVYLLDSSGYGDCIDIYYDVDTFTTDFAYWLEEKYYEEISDYNAYAKAVVDNFISSNDMCAFNPCIDINLFKGLDRTEMKPMYDEYIENFEDSDPLTFTAWLKDIVDNGDWYCISDSKQAYYYTYED